MPGFPDLTEPLTDGRVALRLPSEWDIPDILIAYQDDPGMHLRLGERRPPTGAELGSASERHDDQRRAGESVRLTIVEPGSDDCRGRVTVHHVNWTHGRAELGIWIAPQLRRRGVARGALRLAAGWLFDACHLARLELVTEPDNEPMLRSAGAAGFVREALLRSYAFEHGRRIDVVLLSLLPADLNGAAP